MRKFIFIVTGLLFLAGTCLKADGVTFKASAPNAVVMGQQFQLTYTVNEEGAGGLRTPDLTDFDVLMGPTSSVSRSIQYINGKSSSSYSQTFTYVLMPKKEGTFNLGPATIKIKNSNYSSNSLVIKVLPSDKTAEAASSGSGGSQASSGSSNIGGDELFVRMNVSKRSVYEQEGFLVTFKLYSLYDAALNDVKFPEFEGFLAQDIELNPQWTLENYNGRNYRAVVIKQTVLYPQRSGKITIEGGKYDAVVRIRSKQRVRSIFDDFFDTYQDVKRVLTTAPVTIDVKPLPSGKPASFQGAVGSYTMKASISSDLIKTNEAVTINVTLSGNGNIKLAKNPVITFPNDFEVYDPKVNNNIKTTPTGTSGTKSIKYMAIPRYAGDFVIPAVQFSYFDPKDGSYKTLSSQPFKLHVEKGVGGEISSGPVISNFGTQESVKYLGQDIRYIKVSKPHFVSNKEIFFGSFMYIMAYVLIAVLFIVFFAIYRKQVKENANIALVRTKKANKIAVRRLKKTKKLLKERKKEEFYDEVLHAVWGYLSDKLNIPQANLTKDNVEAELMVFGVDKEVSDDFINILNTCEFARYAPSQASEAMEQLFKQTVNAIGKMENIIKKS